MSNTYSLKSVGIIEALNAIDHFKSTVERFENIHEGYSHTINLLKVTHDLWDVNFTINHEK